MAMTVIVLIADRDDPRHGEITILHDMGEAERLIERLLESGFEQERMRVFGGAEMDFRITERPVVALVGGVEARLESEATAAETEDAAAEATAAETEDAAAEATAAETEDAAAEATAEPEEAPDPAFVKDGVRFSSLFKST